MGAVRSARRCAFGAMEGAALQTSHAYRNAPMLPGTAGLDKQGSNAAEPWRGRWSGMNAKPSVALARSSIAIDPFGLSRLPFGGFL